jgi:aminoglycoside phosphotransferase (APT) family kinase protein
VTELDTRRLRAYLASVVPGGIDGELTVRLFAGGRSNPTYEIRDDSRAWVLRRPPFGHVLATAHDMRREHRVLTALTNTDVPVPTPLVLCEDPEVIGAPFYVMARLEGRVLADPEDTAALRPEQRARLSEAVVDVLARLHDVDVREVGLADWGRPAGYLQRQLARWRDQWEASTSSDRPEVDELLTRLARSVPETTFTGVVHGDVKLDNLMVDADDPTRIVGVLDWEMSTHGDVLADLGTLLTFWDRPGEPAHPLTRGATAFEGFPGRDWVVEEYARRRGIEVPEIDWYVVFADVKTAVILEGIRARHHRGQTVGEGFEDIGDMVAPLLERALARASSSAVPALRRGHGRARPTPSTTEDRR